MVVLLEAVLLLNMLVTSSFDSSKISRIIWLSEDGDEMYLININDNKWNYLFSKEELLQELSNGEVQVIDEIKTKVAVENEIKESHKKIRNRYFKMIKELYKMIQEPHIFTSERNKYIKVICKKYEISRNSFDEFLKRYWKGGGTKNSLLPNFGMCGGRGKEKVAGASKRGRPTIYKETKGINIDDDIKKIFRKAIRKFYNTQKQNSLTTAYELMIKEYFSEKITYLDNNEKLIIKDKEKIPTINQFRYWFNKERDLKKEITMRKGARIFEQKYRAVLDSANKGVLGPGMEYQIDATVGDIYLVSQYNSEWIIGRPIIYMIMDTFSRMITGVYVGLEGPNWVGAMTALHNAMSSKVDFCKQYEINIKEDEWNCKYIPFSILADRGELEGFQADNVVNNLGIQLSNTPPYRAEWKSIIEQNFRCINLKVKPLSPAVVLPDFRQRGAKDYRLESRLTLRDFTKVVINSIIYHNNFHILKYYRRDKDMVADGVEPIPKELWEWGIKNRSGILRTLDSDTLKYSLMPRDEATITEKGIRFKGVYYSSLLAIKERRFEKARLNGKYKIQIIYDPRNMNNIYWVLEGDEGYEKCFLLNKEYRYLDMCVEEIEYLKKREIMMINKGESKEIEEKINLIENIENIVEEASLSKKNLKNKDLKGIRTNRAVEKIINRKSESFILDENAQIKSESNNEDKLEKDDLELIKAKLRRLNNE